MEQPGLSSSLSVQRQSADPINWSLTSGVRPEETAERREKPQKHCEVTTACCSALSSEASKEPQTTQSTERLGLPPTAPAETSNQPLIAASSSASPHQEPLACLFDHMRPTLPENRTRPVFSASSQAQQLKRKRIKKPTVTEERL